MASESVIWLDECSLFSGEYLNRVMSGLEKISDKLNIYTFFPPSTRTKWSDMWKL